MNLQTSSNWRHAHPPHAAALFEAIDSRSACVGIIGLGYVGLPLAVSIARAGFRATGFDVDARKVECLSAGQSYIEDVKASQIGALVRKDRLCATDDFARLAECDIAVICVPTPLTKHAEPDLSHLIAACRSLSAQDLAGKLVIVESTTYPGTTTDIVAPLLQRDGLVLGETLFLGYSPEREDPGNLQYQYDTIPKIVSGDCPVSGDLVTAFYDAVVTKTVRVSNTKTAEAVKITENIFRSVNIALVNELKLVFDPMGIDIWEVIDGAATKPFGFMPFHPGPGVGGHCIPIDPHYLSWKAREYGVATRFIDLAGQVNASMAPHVVCKLRESLDARLGKALSQSSILVAGVAYKKNISDMRGSPGLDILSLLDATGAEVHYTDPHVPHLTKDCRASVDLATAPTPFDAVVLTTDHEAFDYTALSRAGALVIDTRNAFERRGLSAPHIVKA